LHAHGRSSYSGIHYEGTGTAKFDLSEAAAVFPDHPLFAPPFDHDLRALHSKVSLWNDLPIGTLVFTGLRGGNHVRQNFPPKTDQGRGYRGCRFERACRLRRGGCDATASATGTAATAWTAASGSGWGRLW